MTNQKYALSSRIIHWFMAILILGILAVGIYMTQFLPKDSPNHLQIYELHKSFGVIALVFIFIRVINRLIFKAPKLPQSMPRIEQILGHLGHLGLYVLMLIVPLSGYLMSNSFGFVVKFFSAELPLLISTDFERGKIFAAIHELGAYALLALIVVHILAVIKHRFFDKPENDVLKRMI
ncbi:MAG: cytochrome b [Rickettsiales bacterium]|nr:cytochrome b [Rickettsiales bacterium]